MKVWITACRVVLSDLRTLGMLDSEAISVKSLDIVYGSFILRRIVVNGPLFPTIHRLAKSSVSPPWVSWS